MRYSGERARNRDGKKEWIKDGENWKECGYEYRGRMKERKKGRKRERNEITKEGLKGRKKEGKTE